MNALKEMVAKAALSYLPADGVLGIGTGSTINVFIEALATKKHLIEACVASSKATEERLRFHGIPVVDLNSVDTLPLYIDSADEVTNRFQMVKGGGGALTREKIVASVAEKFLCLIDESKLVKQLGAFPIAVEVIPMARSFVARELVKLEGDPEYREGFITDNHNIILDVHNLSIFEPIQLEERIKMIPGVVECGLFAKRSADKVLIATASGTQLLSA